MALTVADVENALFQADSDAPEPAAQAGAAESAAALVAPAESAVALVAPAESAEAQSNPASWLRRHIYYDLQNTDLFVGLRCLALFPLRQRPARRERQPAMYCL